MYTVRKKLPVCPKCKWNDVYFEQHLNNKVMMKCKRCGEYIKWASPEEYEGKEIIPIPKSKNLF